VEKSPFAPRRLPSSTSSSARALSADDWARAVPSARTTAAPTIAITTLRIHTRIAGGLDPVKLGILEGTQPASAQLCPDRLELGAQLVGDRLVLVGPAQEV